MKKITLPLSFIAMCLVFVVKTQAQIDTPRVSQHASVSQRVGITDIAIEYSRPSVNGRQIWGALVPYGFTNLGFGTSTAAPWRAGADENTTISFSNDVTIAGKPVKAGTYALFMEVKENNQATFILSNNSTSWGSFFYDPSEDALRVPITTKSAPFHELLTYEFNTVTPTSATVSLIWGEKEFPVTIEVPVHQVVLEKFRNDARNQIGFSRQNWEQAASYALNNGGNLDEALTWVDNAIAGQFYSQKTPNNLALKAQILNKKGKNQEANVLFDEAASMANINQLNTLGYQMLNAKDYDRALKYFKMNVENNPTDANVYDSLGECYKTMGDTKNAIKYFKKSLSLNPPANVKANSEKHLKELGAL